MSQKHRGSRHFAKLDRKRWSLLRLRIFERDGWRCCRCGKAGRLECDYLIPLDKGGDPYSAENLQTLCSACHRIKTADDVGLGPDPARDAWREMVARIESA